MTAGEGSWLGEYLRGLGRLVMDGEVVGSGGVVHSILCF